MPCGIHHEDLIVLGNGIGDREFDLISRPLVLQDVLEKMHGALDAC